jgi:hypothetical protein
MFMLQAQCMNYFKHFMEFNCTTSMMWYEIQILLVLFSVQYYNSGRINFKL